MAWRRVAAAGIVLLLPAWGVAPIVLPVVLPDEPRAVRRPLALEGTRGLSLGERQIAREHLRDVEELVAYLATVDPPDAPILLLTNEEMIAFLSGRPRLFGDHGYSLFLAAWGMLPRVHSRELDTEAARARLQQARDVLVVHRVDPTAANLRRALPKLSAVIEREFDVVARFGVYRVLRRRSETAG